VLEEGGREGGSGGEGEEGVHDDASLQLANGRAGGREGEREGGRESYLSSRESFCRASWRCSRSALSSWSVLREGGREGRGAGGAPLPVEEVPEGFW